MVAPLRSAWADNGTVPGQVPVNAGLRRGGPAAGRTTYVPWRWVLFINVPIGILVAAAPRAGRIAPPAGEYRMELTSDCHLRKCG